MFEWWQLIVRKAHTTLAHPPHPAQLTPHNAHINVCVARTLHALYITQLKVVHECDDLESSIAYVGADYELYAILGPLVPVRRAVTCCNIIHRWIKVRAARITYGLFLVCFLSVSCLFLVCFLSVSCLLLVADICIPLLCGYNVIVV